MNRLQYCVKVLESNHVRSANTIHSALLSSSTYTSKLEHFFSFEACIFRRFVLFFHFVHLIHFIKAIYALTCITHMTTAFAIMNFSRFVRAVGAAAAVSVFMCAFALSLVHQLDRIRAIRSGSCFTDSKIEPSAQVRSLVHYGCVCTSAFFWFYLLVNHP